MPTRGIARLTYPAVLVALLLALSAPAPAQGEDPGEVGRTPPRLSLADGEVSFWRPGSDDWEPARVNLALAPGDALYTGADSSLEVQIAGRVFLRAASRTQLGFPTQEPDFVQIQVTAGRAALDVRDLAPGRSIEVNTPNAAFTVEHPGYYRFDVTEEMTVFAARRGGSGGATIKGGRELGIESDDQVVVDGIDAPSVATYRAPPLDDWDHWNYDRTDRLLEAESSRYLPEDVYGARDLDEHGTWRSVPTYGRVWVPRAVTAEWAPYSTGRWLWDPYYGWTWVDDEPWGWAPYHYGRWVHLDSYWAWAPGPVLVAPVYSPALVAFFGGGGVRVSVGIPFVSWVALGWGEPIVPWWGPVGYVGVPCWRGWHGPRVVHIRNYHYRNERVHGALVAVPRHDFDRRDVRRVRLPRVDARELQPVHGRLPVAPTRVVREGRSRRPPAFRDTPVVKARRERAAVTREAAAERRLPALSSPGQERRSPDSERARRSDIPPPPDRFGTSGPRSKRPPVRVERETSGGNPPAVGGSDSQPVRQRNLPSRPRSENRVTDGRRQKDSGAPPPPPREERPNPRADNPPVDAGGAEREPPRRVRQREDQPEVDARRTREFERPRRDPPQRPHVERQRPAPPAEARGDSAPAPDRSSDDQPSRSRIPSRRSRQ